MEQIGACERDIHQFPATNDVEGVVFACVYLKRETLKLVGLLDEDYFSHFADTDYCFRVKERGLRVVCCGSVRVIHHEDVSTRVNGVPAKQMFESAQKVFRRKWESKLLAERYTRKIGWHSLMNFPTGYAISSRELATALDRNGVHVAYQYVYGPGTLFPPDEPDKSETKMAEIIRARPLDAQRPQVVYGQGDIFYRNFGAYKVGFTMLETDGIPAEWARQANLMDEVWCPSEFNVKTFRDSGVTRPIHVIPLGIDPGYFNPQIRTSRVSERYTFLSVFEWGERKAPELLMRAFNDEFRFQGACCSCVQNSECRCECGCSRSDSPARVASRRWTHSRIAESGCSRLSIGDGVPVGGLFCFDDARGRLGHADPGSYGMRSAGDSDGLERTMRLHECRRMLTRWRLIV